MKVSDNNRNVSAIDILGSNLKRFERYSSATIIVFAILLVTCVACTGSTSGELTTPIEERTPEKDNKEFISIERLPMFPDDGDSGLLKWVQSNLKYPEIAKKNGVQGRVVVQFVVKKDGSIGEIKVVRSVEPTLDEEAVRIVKMLPNFVPGEINGEPVDVWYTLPIKFNLPN